MHDRPWMTALEMQFSALRFANAIIAANKTPIHVALHRQALAGLKSAAAFSWSKDCISAVFMAAKTIPQDIRFSPQFTLPLHCWWWFDVPMPLISNSASFSREELAIRALLISRVLDKDGRDGLAIMTFGVLEKDAPFATTGWFWRFGESLAELHTRYFNTPMALDERYEDGHHKSDQTSTHVRYLSRFVCAASTWLNQRILTLGAGQIERHRRKQLEREQNVPITSDVKIVQLRRTESQPHLASSAGEHIDWSCRWIVGGHWRNQSYKNEHKLIYILPYVKGPEDKPLKVPSHTVYQVNR